MHFLIPGFWASNGAGMGVSVSIPDARSKVKYIQTDDCDEHGDHLLNDGNSWKHEAAVKGTTHGAESFQKRNDPHFTSLPGEFSFKSGKGKAKSTFDCFDIVNSRKSVPFAELPLDTDSHILTYHTACRDLKSDGKVAATEKRGKVLYLDVATTTLEQGTDLKEETSRKLSN